MVESDKLAKRRISKSSIEYVAEVAALQAKMKLSIHEETGGVLVDCRELADNPYQPQIYLLEHDTEAGDYFHDGSGMQGKLVQCLPLIAACYREEAKDHAREQKLL